MSLENVEIVRRVYEALNRGDWDAVFGDTDPDFEITTERGLDAGTLRRRDAIQRVVQDYIAMFDRWAFEPEEFRESGDHVLVIVRRRARIAGSRAEIVGRNGHLWTVRDGRILSMKTFPDPGDALEAAGFTE